MSGITGQRLYNIMKSQGFNQILYWDELPAEEKAANQRAEALLLQRFREDAEAERGNCPVCATPLDSRCYGCGWRSDE